MTTEEWDATVAPAPPFDPPEFLRWEVSEDDPLYWTTDPAVVAGRRCRFWVDGRGHGVPAVVVLYRGRHRPYGYCGQHMYGRWIADGKVVRWVLREAVR